MAPDENEWSIEELEAEIQRLTGEKVVLRARQRELTAIVDRKRAELRAKSIAAGMSQAEREALAQQIEAMGIESEESVNGVV